MKEIGCITEINCMTEIGTSHEVIIKETNLGMTMEETDPTLEIDNATEMFHIAEIEHMSKINHTTEIGLIVEIDCKTIKKVTIEMTTEMIIAKKIIEIRDIREGLDITMKMLMKTGTARIMIGINIDTNTEMTAMTEIEVGLEKEVTCLRQGKMTSQRLNKSIKSYDS